MIPHLYIEEPMTPAEAERWTTREERAAAAAFRSERRRTEYLAWRALVRRELGIGTAIAYNPAGAPVVDLPGIRIGVAHCPGRIAVAISDRACAVDIELEERDFRRAAPRFLRAEERALSDSELLPAAVWCAKETLYKLAGERELDLLRDIRISEVDFEAGSITGRIRSEAPLSLSLLRTEGYLAVYKL